MRIALLMACCLVALAQPAKRTVAITIDDLPLGAAPQVCEFPPLKAMTEKLLAPYKRDRIPLTGFVIGRTCDQMDPKQRQSILEMWLDAGAELGNHTWSHPDLNRISLEAYQEDVLKGDASTRPIAEKRGGPFRFFRHPYLHAGPDAAKKDGLASFLVAHKYQVAPVTLDNSDWMFAAIYRDALERGDRTLADRVKGEYLPYMESIFAFFEKRSIEVVGRAIAQTLLIHANQLNADCMADLLGMIRKRGYTVISLDEALKDSTYSQREAYVGTGGFSWLHRWAITKGLKPKGEPDEPPFIADAYRRLTASR